MERGHVASDRGQTDRAAGDRSSEQRGWVSIGISVAALLVAGFSLFIARANHRIAQGATATRLVDAYASHEMDRSLKVLGDCRDEIAALEGDIVNRTWFPTVIIEKVRDTYPEISDPEEATSCVRAAGRRLHWFVKSADILRRNGALSATLFRECVAATNGYRLWAEVWLPHLKNTPLPSQPTEHLAWADILLKEFPPSDDAA